MSGADLWEDGYPHGTVEGYDGGCRGGSCPAGVEHGLSCKKAKLLSNGDIRYGRLVREGKTPAEIAAALAEETHQTPEPKKDPLPTPNDVAHTKRTVAETVPDTVPTPAARPTNTADNFETFSPLTTDKWTSGLSHRAKTEKLREIREWARTHGFPGVPTHGKIPQDALAAYDKAYPAGQVVVTALQPRPVNGGIIPAILANEAEALTPLDPRPGEVIATAEFDQTWPGNRGDRVDKDPTHGRVDKDIQEQVDRLQPATVGERVALEQTLQERRDLAEQGRQLASQREDLVAAGVNPAKLEVPLSGAACRVCGCTDWDCSQCIARTGGPCSWVETDLCSACVAEPLAAAEIEEAMDGARERAEMPADDFRPDWAGVTIPAAIRQARTIAARLEEQNANLTRGLTETFESLAVMDNELSSCQENLHQTARSLEFVLRKWREAAEKLEQLADAEEHLDVAAQRIENQEHLIITLQAANDALRTALAARGPEPRSPWWKRGGR